MSNSSFFINKEIARVRLCSGLGATGAVGTIIRQLLEAHRFPLKRIKFVASARSAGKKLPYAGREITIEELKGPVFDDVDLAISSTPDDVARDFIPDAVRRGCLVIDESGYWRMDPTCPWSFPRSIRMPCSGTKA